MSPDACIATQQWNPARIELTAPTRRSTTPASTKSRQADALDRAGRRSRIGNDRGSVGHVDAEVQQRQRDCPAPPRHCSFARSGTTPEEPAAPEGPSVGRGG